MSQNTITTQEETILAMLSKSERVVYDHMKKESGGPGGHLKQSMSEIGKHTNLSEATVHRAVRKLRQAGVIGIVPSMEKAEANETVFYGAPEPEKQASDIFHMISELSANSKRFESILSTKQLEVDTLRRELSARDEIIEQLKQQLNEIRATGAGFDPAKIISSQALPDGTTAYIVGK